MYLALLNDDSLILSDNWPPISWKFVGCRNPFQKVMEEHSKYYRTSFKDDEISFWSILWNNFGKNMFPRNIFWNIAVKIFWHFFSTFLEKFIETCYGTFGGKFFKHFWNIFEATFWNMVRSILGTFYATFSRTSFRAFSGTFWNIFPEDCTCVASYWVVAVRLQSQPGTDQLFASSRSHGIRRCHDARS